MNNNIYKNVVVPESVLLKVERPSGYGSVQGLDDEELAEPAELERQIFRKEWGSVLALPVRGCVSSIRPAMDEDGGMDFGAFGTVDFDRLKPEFDKARYKADKLKEQLRDVLIICAMLNERVKIRVKNELLRLVRIGRIETDQIKDWDMWQLAKHYMRALKLYEEIRRLRKYSRDCRQEKLQELFDSLG